MDVLAVHRVVSGSVERARQGGGPTLIECKTYRYRAHCMVIPDRRDPEETQRWQERDPIVRFEQYLLEREVMGRGEQARLKEEVRQTIEEAEAFAEASPFPDPDTVAENLWA